jgi:hypothetical protein
MSRPPLPSVSSEDSPSYGDPFADRERQTHFQEPTRPYDSTASLPRPFESTVSLPVQGGYLDDEYVEKQPLTGGETISHSGGFYPPGYVPNRCCFCQQAMLIFFCFFYLSQTSRGFLFSPSFNCFDIHEWG